MQDWNPFESTDQQPLVEEVAVDGPAIQIRGGDGEASQLLSTAERRELARIGRIRHVDAGAKLFEADSAAHVIFNIVSGVAKKSGILVDGRQPIVGFFFAHDLLGMMFENGRYTYTATAVTPLTVYCLPIAALEELLRRKPSLQLHFLRKLSYELRAVHRQAVALRCYGPMQKLALFLDCLNRHPQVHTDRTGLVVIPMTRADIADYVGLAPESVSRALRGLQRQGIIELVRYQHFRIRDHVRLKRLLSGDDAGSVFRL